MRRVEILKDKVKKVEALIARLKAENTEGVGSLDYTGEIDGLKKTLATAQINLLHAERYARYVSTPMQTALDYLDRAGTCPALEILEAEGKLRKWKRRPYLYFLPNARKTAVMWAHDHVRLAHDYRPKTPEDARKADALLKGIKERFGVNVQYRNLDSGLLKDKK